LCDSIYVPRGRFTLLIWQETGSRVQDIVSRATSRIRKPSILRDRPGTWRWSVFHARAAATTTMMFALLLEFVG
jgi:hypothetical protein